MDAQDRWLPLDSFDLDPVIGVTPADSGLTYIPWQDSLILTVDSANGEFAEITTGGTLVGFFDGIRRAARAPRAHGHAAP